MTPHSRWWRSPEGTARVWVAPRWSGEAGVRHLLFISVPLVINGFTAAVNLFFDRYFLSRFDLVNHMPASQGAGTAWWTLQSLLVGTVGYVSVFVAQYTGARRPERIGPSVWQALHVSFLGGAVNIALLPLWAPFFRLVHGPGPMAELEGAYGRILGLGSVFLLINGALSSFYAGRGKTVLVMLVGFIVMVANVVLNRWLVFSPPEWLPFIEPGIGGAGWGTVFSLALGTAIYAACFLHRNNEEAFASRSGWRFDRALMTRILRYALPQGLHLFVEVASFGLFVLMLGRLGPVAFTASTIALTINMLIFIPMLGVAQGVGILTGQFVGHARPHLAEQTTCAGMLVNTLAMVPVVVVFALWPEPFVDLFLGPEVDTDLSERLHALARVFLLWVAVYAIADAWNVTYGFSIKGAGDTRFVLNFTLLSSTFLFAIPCVIVGMTGGSPIVPWIAATVFIFALAIVFFLRFRSGHWKTMQVIEAETTKLIEQPDLG